MDALVASIVQSDAGSSLTTAQLQALTGLLSSTAVVLLPSHSLFLKLANNLAQLSDTAESLLSLRLCLYLCTEPSHRDTVFALIETHYSAVEAALLPSITMMRDSQSSSANRIDGDVPQLKLLTTFILVLLTAGGDKMRVTDLIEFLGSSNSSVESTVHVLVMGYGDVCGVFPGVAAAAAGPLQAYIVGRLLQLLQALTFWTTYEELHKKLGVLEGKSVAVDTGLTPLEVSAGPFRHHVGQVVSHLLKYDFFSYVSIHLARLAQHPLTAAPPVHAEWMVQVQTHLMLLDSLLTLTDQFAGLLRRAILRANVVPKVCDPLLLLLSRHQQQQQQLSIRAESVVSLLTQCVSLTATLTYRSAEAQQYWTDKSPTLTQAVDNIAAAVSTFSSPGTFAELIAQLVRLIVNARVMRPAAVVLRLWREGLDEAGQRHVAHRLSNPKSRSRPLDITSPAYDELRPVFRLNAVTNSANAKSTATAKSTGKSQPRRHRPSRRQRLRRRFQLLAQLQAAAQEEPAPGLLQSLESTDDGDDDASSSCASSETSVETTSIALAKSPPDLSRWRRGPPPPSLPLRYVCALSHRLVSSSPVVSSTGFRFDEDVILDYLQSYQVCPISGAPMTARDLVVDLQLKEELNRVRDNFM